LQEYARACRFKRTEGLFFGTRSERTSEETGNTQLRALAVRAGVEKKVTVHVLLATCSTLLHEDGVSLLKI